ncbi:DUF4124 domain-containing protein [Halopseudomonas pertucinogena]|uniref:DUF4124 domain-containing protein n=1 Tax=Halopseudomonas pertucinogena TaxID=86175 RepID=A0ABQ2CQV7_9GAMM|nr:DUF4124 domain-containing protein [Halopseudomonas pertucinogena]GGJ04113.1 hypothetical protein GCM10009083_21150 [Halopseudomonas pertucinogena]
MYKRVLYPALGLMLGGMAVTADATELYRYVNDKGITVLDRSVPPQFVSRGYEVLDKDGRVKQVVPAAPTPDELRAMREAEKEQRRQRSSDETLLRLYSSVADLDRAHQRQIQQIETLIATAEAGLMTLRSQRDDVQSRAASQERAGRKVDPLLLQQLENIEAERRRLERQIRSNRAEIDAVNTAFTSRRERLAQLLPD